MPAKTKVATGAVIMTGLAIALLRPNRLPDARAEYEDTIGITGVVRDFSSSHADFGVVPSGGYGHYAGTVLPTLGEDGYPVYAGDAETSSPVTSLSIVDGDVVVGEPFSVEIVVIGSAMDAGAYYRPATVRVNVGAATHDPFGPFEQPVDANISDNPAGTGSVVPGTNPRKVVLPGSYAGGTTVSVVGRSWSKVDESFSGLLNSHWTPRYTAAGGSPRVFALRDGDPVPQIPGLDDQLSIEEYVEAYVDEATGTMALGPHQVIYLYEVGTSDLSSTAADFQDIIVLVSFATSADYFATHDSLAGEGSTAMSGPLGYKVASGWHDAAGNPIAPHLSDTSGAPDACGTPIADTPGVAGAPSSGGITSPETFSHWFHDQLGQNISVAHTIQMSHVGGGVYDYTADGFHPIDGALLGNEGDNHNYHFTWSFSGTFEYESCADQFFEFEGADNAWLFIDGQLVMDVGGVLPGTGQYVQLDRLGLVDGQRYAVSFFYAQRQTTSADFRLRSNLFGGWQNDTYAVSMGFD